MVAQFNEIAQRFLSGGSRSTALRPLGWLLGLLFTATIASFVYGCPSWIGTCFAIGSFAAVALYIIAYIYFAFTDKDALRSETYHIQKMAIERGFFGDDISGIHKFSDIIPQVKTLAVTPPDLGLKGEKDDK